MLDSINVFSMPVNPLSQPVKLAIASDLTTGATAETLAAKYGTSTRTIYRINQQLRQSPVKPALVSEWRETGNALAFNAVKDGLDCKRDLYKRANIGLVWLKGTGLLMPDNVTQINNLYASMPEDLRAGYEQEIASTTQQEITAGQGKIP